MGQTYFGGDKNVIIDTSLESRKDASFTGTVKTIDLSATRFELSGNILIRDDEVDVSHCIITKDDNILPYSTAGWNVRQDGSNNLLLQTMDGGVVIDAHTEKRRQGGLKIFNSGGYYDPGGGTLSFPRISLVPYKNTGGAGTLGRESYWETNNDGQTILCGSENLRLYSGEGAGTDMEFKLGNASSEGIAIAMKMSHGNAMSGSGEDYYVSINDMGGWTAHNKISTYINSPNYHIWSGSYNPAIHVDATVDKVKINAPLEIKNSTTITAGIQGTVDISNINVDTSAILPSNTTIHNRLYSTGAGKENYLTLKADGFQEFTFDTANISDGDWVSIAYVGNPNKQPISASRASGIFELMFNNSGNHQTVVFESCHIYGNGRSVDVLTNCRYGQTTPNFNAIRQVYASVYDGAILQVQFNKSATTTVDVTLKIKNNYNNNGWWCDISGSPIADNTPMGYNTHNWTNNKQSTYNGNNFLAFSSYWPDIHGVVLNEHVDFNMGPTAFPGVAAGCSVHHYTSDKIFHKIYMKDTLDMSSNNVVGLNNLYRDSDNKQPITIGSNGSPGTVGNTMLKSIQFTEPIRLMNSYGTLDLRDYLNYLNTDGLLGYDKDKDFIMTTEAGDQKYLSAPSTVEFIMPLNQVTWLPSSSGASWAYPTKAQRTLSASKNVCDVICGSGVGNTMFSGASAANNGFDAGMGGQYFCPFVSPHDGILTGATLYPFADGRAIYLTTNRSIHPGTYKFDIEIWVCEVTPTSGNISKAGLILNNCPGVVAAKAGTEGTTSKKLFTLPQSTGSSSFYYPLGNLPQTVALQSDNSFKIIKDKPYMIIMLERRDPTSWPSGGTLSFYLSSSTAGGYITTGIYQGWNCSTNPIKIDLQVILRAPA